MNSWVEDIIKNAKFEKVDTGDDEHIEISTIPCSKGNIDLAKFTPQSTYKPHKHNKSSAYFIFLVGTGIITLDGKEHNYKPGFEVEVPAGTMHGFQTNEETIFLSIQSEAIMDPETGEIDLEH